MIGSDIIIYLQREKKRNKEYKTYNIITNFVAYILATRSVQSHNEVQNTPMNDKKEYNDKNKDKKEKVAKPLTVLLAVMV